MYSNHNDAASAEYNAVFGSQSQRNYDNYSAPHYENHRRERDDYQYNHYEEDDRDARNRADGKRNLRSNKTFRKLTGYSPRPSRDSRYAASNTSNFQQTRHYNDNAYASQSYRNQVNTILS